MGLDETQQGGQAHGGPHRGLLARKRHKMAERLERGAREKAADLADTGSRALHAIEPKAREKAREAGQTAAREGGLFVAALLLTLLAVVFVIVSVLAVLAFGVVALAGPLPVWAAGFIGTAALILLAALCTWLAQRELRGMKVARRLERPKYHRPGQHRAGVRPSPRSR